MNLEAEVSKMLSFVEMIHSRNEVGITMYYWTDLECIEAWSYHSSHREAQQKGKNLWC